jgi:hypothetical protein
VAKSLATTPLRVVFPCTRASTNAREPDEERAVSTCRAITVRKDASSELKECSRPLPARTRVASSDGARSRRGSRHDSAWPLGTTKHHARPRMSWRRGTRFGHVFVGYQHRGPLLGGDRNCCQSLIVGFGYRLVPWNPATYRTRYCGSFVCQHPQQISKTLGRDIA